MRSPVSVKGVSLDRGRVILLRNGRDEWELPGGRLEAGERVEVGPLLDARVYEPLPGRRVPAYGCSAGKVDRVAYGAGRVALGSFGVDALEEIELPAGYARAVWAWAGMVPMDRPGF